MEHLLCEPVELTELELDAVSGGAFGIQIGASGSIVIVHERVTITNKAYTLIQNAVDNSINVGL
jgi:hypothetical protein